MRSIADMVRPAVISTRSRHSPAFKAANDEEASAVARDWAMTNKPQLYEAVEAKLRRGDELVAQWPVNDANFR
jgi:hypothetical protein